VTGRDERIERGHRECRRAREHEAQTTRIRRAVRGRDDAYSAAAQITGTEERARDGAAVERSRRSFSSFLRMRVRVSSDR
jgi:hypothetical protein